MRIKLPIDTSNLDPGSEQFVSFVSQVLNGILNILNGNVQFTDNCLSELITVTFNSANVQQAISHKLGRLPSGYILCGSRAATTLYDGASPSTTSSVFIQSTVATTVKILVFA